MAQAQFTKVQLSGSTNGRPILVVATSTPGTTLHTATSTAGALDSLYIAASNTDTTDRKLTIELGGVTSPNDLIEMTIPAESGLVPVVQAIPLSGGVVVRAFAASASVVNVVGYVNRITSA